MKYPQVSYFCALSPVAYDEHEVLMNIRKGSFHVFAILDCATAITELQVTFSYADVIFFGYVPQREIALYYGASIFICLSN